MSVLRSLGVGSVLMTGVALGQAQDKCSAMVNVALGTAKVTAAAMVAAGGVMDGVKLRPALASGLPSFCRVRVVDRPSADSEIRTEVWLPVASANATADSSAALRNDNKNAGWNGRFRGQGNGGFAGVIDYAGMAAAVTEGYATAGTDTGHAGDRPEFAVGHPEKVVDFGWRGVHEMTVEAKAITAAFYGRAAKKAYFAACSDGGREALMEAERFPADYDGILAGAPAWNWTGLLGGGAVLLKANLSRPGGPLPASKVPAIAAAVVAACDAQDGVKDGVVNDPRTCHFDPAVLACKDGDADSCLTAGQVAEVKELFSPRRDASGREILPGYLPGSEDGPGGWSNWLTGSDGKKAQGEFYAEGFQADFVQGRSDWTIGEFDAAKDLKLAEQKTAKAVNATDANLKPFFDRGGKLLMYHGWNDPAIPALMTIEYWDALRRAVGSAAADAAMRLYMVPGMQHCAGGPGATEFGQGSSAVRGDAEHDVFTALETWVEKGKAPGRMVATKPGKNGFTRPLCVYPQVAKYGKGDVNEAGSFVCSAP